MISVLDLTTLNDFILFHLQVVLDSRKRVFSWGFGGYGRLGHQDTKDELVPRLLQFFCTSAGRGVKSVHCGSSYSMAVNEHGNEMSSDEH